ncbi:MAG: helix-turn-helix domain-containing protein [Actinomycetaceae bacterium]|nr:helix-turn-helix domain-containing protein [Actinomycetaceae bacterium]
MAEERLYHPKPGDITLDRLLFALADPVRRDILDKIASDGPQFCGDFEYGIAKSTMSYHFKVLRESGLMHTEAIGRHRRITRRDGVIDELFPGLLDSVGLPPGRGQWEEVGA